MKYLQANGKAFAQHITANALPSTWTNSDSYTYSATTPTATTYTMANLGLSK